MASSSGSTTPRQQPVGVKSPRKRPRSVVAWQSKAEWDQVMVGLYCGDCQLQREALDRVSVWKSRYGSRMPLAVECTADLVRCHILDASGDMKSHELVLTYGLALVRFTNLITERRQKRFNVSLRWLAKQLDIPVWIVDLRHELTHGILPPLATCRKGCGVVLEWLRRTYWSRQLSNGLAGECGEEEEDELSHSESGTDSSQEELEHSLSPSCQKLQELQEKVTDVLTSYKNHQLKALQQLQHVDQACKVWCRSSSEVEWVVAQLKDFLQENREIVARTLLDDGFLIPLADDLQALKINLQESREWDCGLPRPFLRFWQALLRGLHSKDFTQTVLETMFAELQKHAHDPALRSQYLIGWLAKILKANRKVRKKKKSPLALFGRYVSLQWLKLLDSCLDAPCWASPHLLHLILSSMDPPLPPDSQKKLIYLTSIYTQEDGYLASPGSAVDLQKQPIYTVESLRWKMKHSGLARGLSRRSRREEVSPERVEEEEVDEEEEGEKGEEEADDEDEQMDAQPVATDEPSLVESSVALAEKRMALQGSVWQLSSDRVKWKSFPLGRLPGQTDDPDALLVDNYLTMSALDQVVNGGRRSSPTATSLEWSSSGADGLLWTQSELHKLKSGLQLF